MARKELHSQCPRCGRYWCIDEMQLNQCDSCGYPHHDTDSLGMGDVDDYDDYDFDLDTENHE